MIAPLAGVTALVLASAPAMGRTDPSIDPSTATILMPGYDQLSVAGVESDVGPVAALSVPSGVSDDPGGELVSGGDAPGALADPPAKPERARKVKRKKTAVAQATSSPPVSTDWLPGLAATVSSQALPDPIPAMSSADPVSQAAMEPAQKLEPQAIGRTKRAKAPPRLALSRGGIKKMASLDELAEPAATSASMQPTQAPQELLAKPAPVELVASPAAVAPAPLQRADEIEHAVANPIALPESADPAWAQPADPTEAVVAPALAPVQLASAPAPATEAVATASAPAPATEAVATRTGGLSYPWAAPAPPPPPPAPVIETPAIDPEKLAKIDASPEVRAATMAVAAAPNLAVEFLPSTANSESLRDAIIAALKGNPDIQIALARQDFARYGVHQANTALLPKVDLNMAIGGELNTPNAGDSTRLVRKEGSVTLNQNVFDFGATFNDIKRARADYRSAQWGTRERIESISYEITTAYLTVLQQQKLVALTQEKIASAEKILKMVSIQNGLGLNTTADVSRAKAKLENVNAELLDRQSALQQAREAYRRLTKRMPMMAIDQPSPGDALPASAELAVDLIDSRNPVLAQAMENRRSLDRQRAAQTGNLFPKFALTAQGNWKDDAAGATGINKDARAMVTMTYSFLNGGAEIAIRKRIEAKLRESEYEIDRRRREVEQDIRVDFTALEAARAKIATIDSEIASAQKVDELYRQQFREGRRSVFDLLDSQQILFDAKASQIANLTAKQLAEFRVLQRLGGLFELLSQGEPLPNIVTRAPGAPR